MWICDKCDLLNHKVLKNCFDCQTRRPHNRSKLYLIGGEWKTSYEWRNYLGLCLSTVRLIANGKKKFYNKRQRKSLNN